MAGRSTVPFHFAVEFLVLVVAIGAAFDAVRARKHGAGGWALGQALGFFALALAFGIHGALIRPEDADLVVLGIKTGGFLLLALTAHPQAGVAARPLAPLMAERGVPAVVVPGMYASWSAIPAVAAFAVAVRGARAHRVDQDPSTFAFAAAFVAFSGAEVAAALAPARGGGVLVAAHAVRALAALFLGRWLWTSIVGSVRMRFVAATVVLLTVAVLVVSAALNVVIGNTLQDEELKRLREAGAARATRFNDLGEAGLVTAETFDNSDPIGAIVDDRNWTRAQEASREASANNYAAGVLRIAPSNTDLVMLVNRRGRVIGSAERTSRGVTAIGGVESVLLAGSEVVLEARDPARPRPTTSAVTADTTTPDGDVRPQIVVLSASPMEAQAGRVIGAIVVGFRIDERFLREVRQDTSAEATLLVGRDLSATTFTDADAIARAVRPVIPEVPSAVTFSRVLGVGDAQYSTVFVPARAADGRVLGHIALSRGSAALESAQRGMTRTLFLIALFAVAVAAALAWLSGGRVTKPIRSLTGAARELRAGNYDARAKVASADEVGALGDAFNEMAEELQRKTSDLRSAATSEASLRARMEAIVQSMADGLIATDAQGAVVTFNRAAEAMFGLKAERALGRPIGEILSGTSTGGRRLSEAALTGRSAEGTLQRGKATIAVAMTSAPLQDTRGETVGRVVLVRDISREHEAERMKSEFLSNVSHELRTPITPIKGYAEILKRKRFPREKTEQFLNGVLESTERLERIVEILVDFASMEAGRLKPRSEPIDVEGLLDGLAARWQPRAGRHRLVRKVDRALPPVLGDQKLLDRSLNELVDNAVKFSPDGGLIEVSAAVYENGSKRGRPPKIRITVRDQGIGIDRDLLPSLFQDFHQLDGSETRSYGGLGLGLAYVKRIANVHGGDVVVESAPGKGSAFSLVLPAADVPRRAMGAPEVLDRRPAKPVARRPATPTKGTSARRAAKGKGKTASTRATAARRTAAPRRPAATRRATPARGTARKKRGR